MVYEEIEDIAEIRRLNTVLASRLKSSLPFSETRVIGYPSGHEHLKAYFSSNKGNSVLWWTAWTGKNGNLINLWGHGNPEKINSTLTIDVQFNLPGKVFNRSSGGAFLREVSSGVIILAHRGIVTLGYGRFPRDRLFEAMGTSVFEANTRSGSKEFLLIGELESKTLPHEIDIFSANLREVIQSLNTESAGPTTMTAAGVAVNANKSIFSALRNYLKEFAGKRRAFRPKKIQSDCHHGIVGLALEKMLKSHGSVLNSVEIDLVSVRANDILLFEIKTSSVPQSVYTAIGQLSVHEPRVGQLYPNKHVKKVMVLPEKPMAELSGILTKSLSITLVIYTRTSKGDVTFSGLEQL